MLIYGKNKYRSVSHKFYEIEKNGHYICKQQTKNRKKWSDLKSLLAVSHYNLSFPNLLANPSEEKYDNYKNDHTFLNFFVNLHERRRIG